MNLRVNPGLKQDAEAVLGRLGISMSTAVDMFLNQIVLVGGIPFSEKHIVDITDDALADMDALYEHIANKLLAHCSFLVSGGTKCRLHDYWLRPSDTGRTD